MGVSISDLHKTIDSLFPDLNSIDSEATQRACVNRKYYATYHHLLEVLNNHFSYDLSNEGRFGNTGHHKRVVLAFEDVYMTTGSKNAQQLYLKIQNFISKRHKADYYLDSDFDEFDYKQSIKFANDIPDLANKLVEELKNKRA